jgi:3-oxoacyl-[acyl-carrier-protein] synthase II
MTVHIAGEIGECIPEGMSKKDLSRRDRYTIYALAAADQAMAQSGINIDEEDPFRCGVCVGTGIGGIETMQDNVAAFTTRGPRRVSPFAIPKCLANMASGEVGIRHGLCGPNKSVVTACASGTQSIGEAAMLIGIGHADVMVCGGTEGSVIPFGISAFAAMKALSTRNDEPTKASRPFDRDRNGFVMGDGAGILVLESEAHATARGAHIIGEIAGHGETFDAHHVTAPRPDGSAAIRAMQNALRDAQLNPSDIHYFNAHGTSTKYNDAAESHALRAVFGEDMPPVSSTKSMIGHLLGAAGSVEAIACLLTIRDGVIHPSINYDTPDPDCQLNIVANTAQDRPVTMAMSNSLGFGGHNASLIVKRYE